MNLIRFVADCVDRIADQPPDAVFTGTPFAVLSAVRVRWPRERRARRAYDLISQVRTADSGNEAHIVAIWAAKLQCDAVILDWGCGPVTP